MVNSWKLAANNDRVKPVSLSRSLVLSSQNEAEAKDRSHFTSEHNLIPFLDLLSLNINGSLQVDNLIIKLGLLISFLFNLYLCCFVRC